MPDFGRSDGQPHSGWCLAEQRPRAGHSRATDFHIFQSTTWTKPETEHERDKHGTFKLKPSVARFRLVVNIFVTCDINAIRDVITCYKYFMFYFQEEINSNIMLKML